MWNTGFAYCKVLHVLLNVSFFCYSSNFFPSVLYIRMIMMKGIGVYGVLWKGIVCGGIMKGIVYGVSFCVCVCVCACVS